MRKGARVTLPLLALMSADPATYPADDVVAKYRDAVKKQQTATRNLASDVTFEADIPRLKKRLRS